MNQIEVAERIIRQEGCCIEPKYISCFDCPANTLNIFGCGLNSSAKKYEWFKNWLSENKKQENVMEKIQFESESDLRDLIDDILEVYSEEHNEVLNRIIFNAKAKGYIKKSPLQQKVEEAEEIINDYKNIPSDDFNKKYSSFLFTQILIETIQLFKEKYPDWKND